MGGPVEAERFEALLRQLSSASSRRKAARALAGLAFGSSVLIRGTDAAAKRCGPCRKKKKGRCKGSKPNGAPCGGVCQECRGGACLARPDGSGCGTCQECQNGSCVTAPDNTGCNGTGRCLGGTCIARPTCHPSLETCTPAGAASCCSGICDLYQFPPPIGDRQLCGKGTADTSCVEDRDCVSNSCVGYRCE